MRASLPQASSNRSGLRRPRRLPLPEQEGRIRILKDGRLLDEPFLDITYRVAGGGERGLLGLAFAPDYPVSRLFYLNSTRRPDGATILARYRAVTADRADPESEGILVSIAQPERNHNGGALSFGPNDGFLHVALGDGDGAGDQFGNAQSLSSLLGAILRLDVSCPPGYKVPPSKPFVSQPGARPEIWAYGLRNPWRIASDAVTGELYIGDVGQARFEELDAQPASSSGGEPWLADRRRG